MKFLRKPKVVDACQYGPRRSAVGVYLDNAFQPYVLSSRGIRHYLKEGDWVVHEYDHFYYAVSDEEMQRDYEHAS